MPRIGPYDYTPSSQAPLIAPDHNRRKSLNDLSNKKDNGTIQYSTILAQQASPTEISFILDAPKNAYRYVDTYKKPVKSLYR